MSERELGGELDELGLRKKPLMGSRFRKTCSDDYRNPDLLRTGADGHL